MARSSPQFLFLSILLLAGCELRYTEPKIEESERKEVTFEADAIPLGEVPPKPEDLDKYIVRIRAYEKLTSRYQILKQRNDPQTRRVTPDTKFDHLTYIDENNPVFEDDDVKAGEEAVYQVARAATKTFPATYQILPVTIPHDLLVDRQTQADASGIVNPIYGRVLITANGTLSFPSKFFSIIAKRIDFQEGARIEIHQSQSKSKAWPVLRLRSEIVSGSVTINLTNPARETLFEEVEAGKAPTLEPYLSPSLSIEAEQGTLKYVIEDPAAPEKHSKLARLLKTMSRIQVGDPVSWIVDGKRISPEELDGFLVGSCDAPGEPPALYFPNSSTAFVEFDTRPNGLTARWSAEPRLRGPMYADNELTFFISVDEEKKMAECRYKSYRPDPQDQSQLARLFRLDTALKLASRAKGASGCELSFTTADKDHVTVVSDLQLEVADYFRKFPDEVQKACPKSFTTKISFLLSADPIFPSPGDGHRVIPYASKLSASQIWKKFLEGGISFEE